MTKFSDNPSPSLLMLEHVDPSNPSAGYQRLFVDTDHLFKMVDSSGTVTTFGTGLADPMTTRGDIIVRNAANATARLGIGSSGKVLSSDGTDISWQTPAGGGGVTPSYLGYNTVGGSTTSMVQFRMYAKQITAGGSGNVLLGIQAHLAFTVEAVATFGFAVFADSGSDTIGDMLALATDTVSTSGFTSILAHGTGGGISYPFRWFGKGFGVELVASTKYWIGIALLSAGGSPNLHHDTSGSDRYYPAGTGPYVGDGQYGGFTQTNSTLKYSIRALVL